MSSKVNEPIAIIGSACRFAGNATSPSKLWELLESPRDVLTPIPESRFSAEGFYHPDGLYHGHSNVQHSYCITEDPSLFDAEFFGIKPVEAKALDPQQRLLLEVAYEGLESAGLPIEKIRGSDTGVYVGHMCNDYEALLLRDLQNVPAYHGIGVGRSILANRISYFFDLKGPSMTIDTACSSSLVAIHLAAQSLRAGETKTALACGSNLLLGPENYITESKLKMLSPDSRSRMWDQGANGYARGDGVAVVVLKTLSAALADGDHIESIIRETGLNQDGQTKGITMPSASAQTSLIRSTYAKAGLDILSQQDRCQYFEAHGTGTPAGDPIEAEAIQRAFFSQENPAPFDHPLYVGSIKTVLGHTEGAAGVAAILKASLALQHGSIPPNMLFDELSSQVAPFYDNLEIRTSAKPWPQLSEGISRRASVNSFGFGGANAHAILESYDASLEFDTEKRVSPFAPFVFSAASAQSLVTMLSTYSKYLSSHSSISPHHLVENLLQRRSALSFRTFFPAGSIENLKSNIDARLSETAGDIGTKVSSSFLNGTPRILAIFTGQGAQHARMGAELIEKSSVARGIIQDLEAHLANLPENDRPQWSLEKELLADAGSSQLHDARISQPLCTAIQILLVDLLRLANIQLHGLVGHSSGEIGAAYAAGYLSARDAINIAYYRGLHCQKATGRGAMLAVGTSWEDAKGMCDLPEFAGRANVAASNSASTVTISGDEDAITELEEIFEDEGKFRRRLRVDKAYHSHHMKPCAEPYIRSLESSGIQIQAPEKDCTWYSSVYETVDKFDTAELAGTYWADNMVQPVLFSQALGHALESDNFDYVLEIGPHAALKGPVLQELKDLNRTMPYAGTLARGEDAIASLSATLGSLWTAFGAGCVNVPKYQAAMSETSTFKALKDLPTYPWNHDTRHWHESRISQNLRRREQKVHPILGDVTPDSSSHHLSWRNLLRVKEVPWISGHQLQNQTVFPAAGYVVAALEASRFLVDEEIKIQLVDISDFAIHQAMVFDEEDSGVETLVSLTDIDRTSPRGVGAFFTLSAAVGKEPRTLSLMATGHVSISLGESTFDVLPQRGSIVPHMIGVDQSRFYSSLADVGYNYSGPFRGLSSMTRKLGRATGLVDLVPTTSNEVIEQPPFLVHPATLDCALQSIILAFHYPGDSELWSLHVPTRFARIRVNPYLCGLQWAHNVSVPFESARTSVDVAGFVGDVDLYDPQSSHVAIQVEGMRAVPFAHATAADDKKLFSHMIWNSDRPDEDKIAAEDEVTSDEYDLAFALDRVATFYTRSFEREFPQDDPVHAGPFSHYFRWVRHINGLQETSKHVYASKEWMNDTPEDIIKVSERFAHTPDIKMLHIIGQQLPRVIRGETTILEQIRTDGLLDEYYVSALGYPHFSKWLARTTSQIAHRYPQMDILEIGAGTGGATKSILKELGLDFGSYTFTDISTGFFEKAQETFAPFRNRMMFRAFNADQDPESQGFIPHSYDLIVASFVIHATQSLEQSLRNTRRLLKPGGYLVLAEGTNNDSTRGGFIFGTLPGWWAGVDEGRVLSPCVSPEEWDAVLRTTGFSGVDTITPDRLNFIYAGSVLVSQAVDDNVNFLREPFSSDLLPITGQKDIETVIIIGGTTLRVSRLVEDLKRALKRLSRSVVIFKTLQEVDHAALSTQTTVISLTDLEKPVFKDLAPATFESLKKLFGSEKTLLWVTSGRRAAEPHANMAIGFGRSAILEVPELRLQFLDFERADGINATKIAEMVLQLQVLRPVRNVAKHKDLLWAVEPEIVIDADGQQLVPRLKAMNKANDRYNSARRVVTEEVDLTDSSIQLSRHGEEVLANQVGINPSAAALRAMYSTATPVSTSAGPRFLTYGLDQNTQSIIAFTKSLASSHAVVHDAVSISEAILVDCTEATLLLRLWATLVARCIVSCIRQKQLLLLHDPPLAISQAIRLEASKKEVQVIFATDSKELAVENGWIALSPGMPKRQISQLLPKKIGHFCGFGNLSSRLSSHDAILSCLPSGCQVADANFMFKGGVHAEVSSLDEVIRSVVATIKDHPDSTEQSCEVISVRDLVAGAKPNNAATIIDWKTITTVPARTARLENDHLFKSDRTYWLVGLSGTLGLSLCDWMIEHGARYVVISSRNPSNIDRSWLEAHKQRGEVVEVFASDITNRDDMNSVYQTIKNTLPAVAGLISGAMVLRDTAIRDMSFEQMTTVLKPRVDGNLHLDQLFHNENLDFFILLSSMTGVLGNIGQSNYTTSNAFMASLAAHRRQRGLAASVINVGVIVGAGYVTREVSEIGDSSLARAGMMWLSEGDFHQMIAESMKAGKSSSLDDIEISTGLREVGADSAFLPSWYKDPKFARFAVRELEKNAGNAGKAGASIRDRLSGVKTREEIYVVVRETFASKLRALLQIKTRDEALMELRSDEIGIDSLIAVEMRTWFLQNYEANIPVLSILGGVSLADLVNQVVREMPEHLTPNIVSDKEDGMPLETNRSPPSSERESSSAESISGDGSTSYASGSHSGELDVMIPLSETSSAPDIIEKPAVVVERSTSLSFTQSMFWFVHMLIQDKTTLNHTVLFKVSGNLRIDDLREAVRKVGQHHEALRTLFFVDSNQHAMQGVLETGTLELEVSYIQQESDIMKEYESFRDHVFNLNTGEMTRIRMLSQSPSMNYLLVVCHHLILDGMSHMVFMNDLERAYNGQALDQHVLQYPDYAIRQREEFREGKFEDSLPYWRKEFATIPDPLPLNRARRTARQALDDYTITAVDLRIDTQLANKIRAVSRANRSTSFHFYLAAFEVLLYRLTNAKDFAIGIADGNRKEEAMLSSFGPYVNLLPLRFAIKPHTFRQAISEARTKTLEALAHSKVPFEVLLNELRVARSLSHSPIFQAFIDYRQGTQEKQYFSNCLMEIAKFEPGKTAYDLSIDIIDNPGSDALISVMAQEALYSHSDAQNITELYEDILKQFAESPENRITAEWGYRDASVQRSLDLGRGRTLQSNPHETLMHQVRDVMGSASEKTAIIEAGGTSVTYQDLKQKVNVITSLLSQHKVASGQRVAVYQQATVHWVASMLAVLMIGAVYVPLDSGTLPPRVSAVIEDCNPVAILVDSKARDQCDFLRNLDLAVIDVSLVDSQLLDGVTTLAGPNDPAIILYTSGSTGTPKGVVLKHSNLRNEIDASVKVYGLDSGIVVLQQSSFGFDMSVLQLFLALSLGGTLCMIPEDLRGDSNAVTDVIAEYNVTYTCATPSEYSSWLRHGSQSRLRNSSWSTALSGGEAVTQALLNAFRQLNKPTLELFNGYGPTETTCCSTKVELNYREPGFYDSTIPAGLPSPNESIYIVDEKMRLLPQGLRGEIVIGGAGVAAGYLKNDPRAEKSFVPNTYVDDSFRKLWGMIYRTGDCGRILSNGCLNVEGRMDEDTQIKLRGMRVDLKDIEQAILNAASETIAEAVVSVRSSGKEGSQFLVGHVVFLPEHTVDTESYLRELLKQLPLPQYMCPSMLMPIEKIPRTASAKLDRRAVEKLSVARSPADDTLPGRAMSDVESQMNAIWQEVLSGGLNNLECIGLESDFFELGGTSMLLIEIQAQINRFLNTSLRLVDLFNAPTLGEMAQLVERKVEDGSKVSIDWEVETALPYDFGQIVQISTQPLATYPKTILLTGASAPLGRYILRRLLQSPQIEKIICIAVRHLQERLASQQLVVDPRIVYYEGDVRFARFGLSELEAETIFGEVDCAIHNAAEVSHLKSYSSLRSTNVVSTKELVRLCLPRRVPLHYVSTVGVAMFEIRDTVDEVSVRSMPPPTDGADGYSASKWASEQFLEHVNEVFGLPVWIHRPSGITRSADEEQDQNELLLCILQFSRKMKVVPETDFIKGALDLVSIENVSRNIVTELLVNKPRSQDALSYVHHTGDAIIPFDEMDRYLEQESGDTSVKFEKVPLVEWAERAEKAGLQNSLATVLKNVDKLEISQVNIPRFIKNIA